MSYPVAHFRVAGLGSIDYDIQQGRERIGYGLSIDYEEGVVRFSPRVTMETARAAVKELLAYQRQGLRKVREKHGDAIAGPMYREARAGRWPTLLRCLPKLLQLEPEVPPGKVIE